VRAAEAFWLDREERFEACVDRIRPSCFSLEKYLADTVVHTGAVRDGIAWRKETLTALDPITPFLEVWKMGTKVDIVSSEATEKAKDALLKLREELDNFRGVVKNDLSSMKAGSDRVQSEVNKMTQAYNKAVTLLNSEAFATAVQNAERMATALEAISKLSETKLSVAVFKGSNTHA